MPRINSGILNEEARVNAIQNKTFEQLNRNLQYNRRILFRDIDNTSIFSCEKLDPRGKPDIHIHYKDQDHYLSLKSGAAETVQAEDIRKLFSSCASIIHLSNVRKLFFCSNMGIGH